ncbi:MAG: YidC/Oxa1 family membrane protein insertase [Actinomycetota bacterium]
MLDPIFDLLAGLLAWFYSLVPSYGFAIIALTTLVLIVLSPLTYRSTKSMLAMRRLQPQVRRIQKKYAGDREKMNQEMMALYQEHSVSPLSGCLPILVQSPIFIVMFRVLRGITRRASDIGLDLSSFVGSAADAQARGSGTFAAPSLDLERRNFNPEYLDPESELYQALIQDNEMLWLGIDLSRTPLEVLGDSIGSSLPYLLMVAVVAFLGWYQQRQIAGRQTGEISSQQQMIMRIIPWMLPIFSFTMPAGLVLYFIVSALLRIMQQAYLTRTVYADEELNAPIETDDDDDDDDDDDGAPENPLSSLFGGGNANKSREAQASSRHGSRRPVATTNARTQRTRPPRDRTSAATTEAPGRRNRAVGSSKADDTSSGWGRAKRSAAPKNDGPSTPASRRVTPKGESGRPKKK